MSVRESARTLVEDALAQGAEDWIHAPQLLDIAGRAVGARAEARRDVAIGLLTRLVADGLIEIGWVTDGRHHPWGCTRAEAVMRVARDWWSRESPYVRAGDLFWLAVTPVGDSIGRDVWAREGPAAEEDDLEEQNGPSPARRPGEPTLGEEVLARGRSRLLRPSDLFDVASRAGVAEREGIELLALGVLAGLVAAGHLRIGEVTAERFVAWPDPPGETLLQVARLWSVSEGDDRSSARGLWLRVESGGNPR